MCPFNAKWSNARNAVLNYSAGKNSLKNHCRVLHIQTPTIHLSLFPYLPKAGIPVEKITAVHINSGIAYPNTNSPSPLTPLPNIDWVKPESSTSHSFVCQFYELRKLNMLTAVEGYGFVAWFGQYTAIAFQVSLFGFTTPAYTHLFLFLRQRGHVDFGEWVATSWDGLAAAGHLGCLEEQPKPRQHSRKTCV